MPHIPSRRVLPGVAILSALSLSALSLSALSLPAVAQHMDHSMPIPAATAKASAGTLPLKAMNATVVAVPPMIKETSIFGTLMNTGKTPIVLSGVQASVAGQGMLMVTKKASGGMQGMSMAETLTVPAGGKLVLSDIGDHLMLMNLKRPLKIGEALTLTLRATDGRTFTFKATVKKP
ncbi:copper chaperone PCu(A)C [Deinococcus arenicola]|uniref:Copper chaperone PCu(A)C n=1 Tax=Deinococcus arenicola TaxID=2994950 RepID=A0ABU4DRD1_9DEIO|nr:copper chaperone PCu(A)C [Deinococcus sp. ZS9-10]MDV6374254.1 copper chaperone PCu(A)C [Deinococcus sp. ZS9-10]